MKEGEKETRPYICDKCRIYLDTEDAYFCDTDIGTYVFCKECTVEFRRMINKWLDIEEEEKNGNSGRSE